MPLGVGAPTLSGIPGFNYNYGIRANPGGGNANATPLTAWTNTVTTVATAADSVMLPPGYGGERVTVCNLGANSCQLFGYMSTAVGDVVTDVIAPLASGTFVATGLAIAANNTAVVECVLGQGGNTNAITPARWKVVSLG